MMNLLERFINTLKTSIRDKSQSKNAINHNINNIINNFEEDEMISYQDSCIDSIEPITSSSQLISSILPKHEFLKTIVSPKKLEIISFKSLYFNPLTGTMNDGIPMEGINPIIRDNYRLMTKFLNIDLGLTPMNSDELASRGILWKLLNKATGNLLSAFLTKLCGLEELSGQIINYDASDCVLHIVMCQTPESISFVYGNLFTIVKLGCLTKLWINSSICDGLYLFSDISVVPDSIQDLVTTLDVCENIRGHHFYTHMEELKYEFKPTYLLDKVGMVPFGLLGTVPYNVGKIL